MYLVILFSTHIYIIDEKYPLNTVCSINVYWPIVQAEWPYSEFDFFYSPSYANFF